MIGTAITNEMLNRILSIESCKTRFNDGCGSLMTPQAAARLRKVARMKSARASVALDNSAPKNTSRKGVQAPALAASSASAFAASAASAATRGTVPATASTAAKGKHRSPDSDAIDDYCTALKTLDKRLAKRTPLTGELVAETQRLVVASEGPSKRGLRAPMPAGVLFVLYGDDGRAAYIPPKAAEIDKLLGDLARYIETSSDHPLIKAGVIHYELATIYPFKEGNGRVARILSSYYLSLCGYGFGRIASLEERFAADEDAYRAALSMGLHAFYYQGRDNPPHPEIWMEYFLRMVDLFAQAACELAETTVKKAKAAREAGGGGGGAAAGGGVGVGGATATTGGAAAESTKDTDCKPAETATFDTSQGEIGPESALQRPDIALQPGFEAISPENARETPTNASTTMPRIARKTKTQSGKPKHGKTSATRSVKPVSSGASGAAAMSIATVAPTAAAASATTSSAAAATTLPYLKPREREFYDYLVAHGIGQYAPIDMAREFGVSNRTIINWSTTLAAHGMVKPQLVKERVRLYETVMPE